MSKAILRRAFKASQEKKQSKLKPEPGWLGKENGQVNVPGHPGYVYVRITGRPVAEVFNNRVPPVLDLPVLVGFDALQPNLWQILSERTTAYALTNNNPFNNSGVKFHHGQHEFLGDGPLGGQDVVDINLRQFLPLRIQRAGDLRISVYQDIAWAGGQYRFVPYQTIDLAPTVPGAGLGRMNLVVVDSVGSIGIITGTAKALASLSGLTDIPTPPEGTQYVLGAVRTYGGQVALQENRIDTDIVDYRFPMRQTFLSMLDTPNSYTGSANKIVAVNPQETALTFIDSSINSAVTYVDGTGSYPPTKAEISALAGNPLEAGQGKLVLLRMPNHFYLCASDGNDWWLTNLSKAGEASVPAMTSYAWDTMVDANGTHLNAHTMSVGAGWTEVTGSWTISGNEVTNGSSGATHWMTTTDVGHGDFRASVLVRQNADSSSNHDWLGGLLFRYQDAANWMAAMYQSDITGGNNFFEIRECCSGTVTVPIYVSCPEQDQNHRQIDVRCSGSSIQAFIDGGYELDYASSRLASATKCGLIEWKGTNYYANKFKNFEAVQLPSAYIPTGTIVFGYFGTHESTALEASIIYESNPQILAGTSVYKMWYTYGWSSTNIGYAESLDGLTWTEYGSNPIVAGRMRSSVFKDGGVYYMVCSDDVWFDLYTSTNGISWTLDTAHILGEGGIGAWDSDGISNSFVWKEETVWYMLYEGRGSAGAWQIGLATSVDGRSWTKHPSNPVIGGPEQVHGNMWCTKIAGYYYLWCGVSGLNGNLPTWISRFRSTDRVTWERYPQHSMFARRLVEEGANSYLGQVADPFIVQIGDMAYLYYTVTTDGSTPSGTMHINRTSFAADMIGGN